jgi:hypothetical protein
VEAFLEADRVAGIHVRIDVREPDVAELLERLAAAGVALDAVFRDAEGRDVRPDTEALADSVCQSSAAHFVRDPVEFLNSLRDRAV